MILEDDYRKDSLPAEASEKNPNKKSDSVNFLHLKRKIRNYFTDLEDDLEVNEFTDSEAELDAFPLEEVPSDILINTSARKSENPRELKPEEDIEDLGGVELEQGVEQLITQFFQKDVQYMIGLSERDEELSRGWNDDKLFLRFRALVLPNSNAPQGLPMIIMRPTDRPQRNAREYYYGSSSEMYHLDIWRDWKKLAETYPNSNRATVFNALDQEAGGYRDAVHLYLKITTNSENKPVIELEGGWIDFQSYLARILRPDDDDPKLSPKESIALVKKLKAYGIDAVVVNEKEEPISVEKIILEEMMGPLIEKNAERLRAIVTSRAASEYRNLAYRFLTNPNPDKSTPLYYKFLEYEEVLLSLDTNSRKK